MKISHHLLSCTMHLSPGFLLVKPHTHEVEHLGNLFEFVPSHRLTLARVTTEVTSSLTLRALRKFAHTFQLIVGYVHTVTLAVLVIM